MSAIIPELNMNVTILYLICACVFIYYTLIGFIFTTINLSGS